MTLESKDIVVAARDAYNALTQAQQDLVKNIDKLELAEAKIAELEADKAAVAFKTIHAEALSLTVDDVAIANKAAVNAALSAHEELSEAVQSKLTDEKSLLDTLLVKIGTLEDDKAASETVIDIIQSLPTAEELTLDNKAAVEEAREAYEELTEDQQALVTNTGELIAVEEKLEELIEAEITTAITDRIKPGFIGFANTINNQAPNSNPPYKLVVEYNIDGIDATFLFSEEAQEMDPWNGLTGTGLKTAFYSLVNVPEIQGASAGGNDVKFKDEDGNPKSGGGFEWELMLFGAYLIGDIPPTVGEIIGTEQIMNLDCRTTSGTDFAMEITFFFKQANKYTVTFLDYDETVLETQTVEYGSDATAPADLTREGYTFTGWDVGFTEIKADTTVTATYTINKYAVTFKDHDGTELKVEEVNHGENATAPSDPTRDGYGFIGWDKEFNEVKEALTIKALYKDIEAPVFIYDGEDEITLVYNDEFTIPTITATDNEDKTVEVTHVITDASSNIIDQIDTEVVGSYTITYSAEDAAGNKADDLVITVIVEADLTAYNAALAAVTETDYTEASWTTYQGVVAANVVTVENTQAEVDAARTNIIDAQASLITIEDQAALDLSAAKVSAKEAIDEVVLVTEGMTEESIAAANGKLAELKTAAKVAVDALETIEAVETYEFDVSEAEDLLVTIEDQAAADLQTAKVAAKAAIDEVVLATEGMTEESIAAANGKLAELKTAAKAAVDALETIEAVETYEFDVSEAEDLLVTIEDQAAADLQTAKVAAKAAIDEVVLATEGMTEESIAAANGKLAELKTAAKAAVDALETIEAVETYEFDVSEAEDLLVTIEDQAAADLQTAKVAAKAAIDEVVLATEGMTEESIAAANGKLAELKTAAKAAVDALETIEAVETYEFDVSEAEDLLVTIEDQAAPEGLAGVAPTIAEDNDGKITGVDDTMEYKLKSATVWIKVTGTEITGLAAGTYEVRYAAKEGYNAGGAAEVIVPEYEAPIVAAEIESVVAENGKVTITLKEKPTEAPKAEDFSATIAIDGEEAPADLTLTGFTYDNNITITFTFEEVEQTEAEQSVVVAVKLDDGDKVAAVAFIVDAEEVGDAAAAQAVIDAIEALPAVEEITLVNKEAVVAAKVAYEELTEGQKELISSETVEKLDAVFKQVFLVELDVKVAEKISPEVALYTRDGDSLTVEFVTTDGNLLLPAAQGLAIALMDVAYDSTLRIGETEPPFVLNETIDEGGLVGALLTAGAFGGNPVPYSADIIYNTISGITLDGKLTFKLPSDN